MPPGYVQDGKLAVPEEARDLARSVAEKLAALVPEGDRRRVSRELHWSPGHLQHVIQYRQPLKLSEVITLCRHVNQDPAAFLWRALSSPGQEAPPIAPDFDAALEAFAAAAAKAGYNVDATAQLLDLIKRLRT